MVNMQLLLHGCNSHFLFLVALLIGYFGNRMEYAIRYVSKDCVHNQKKRV